MKAEPSIFFLEWPPFLQRLQLFFPLRDCWWSECSHLLILPDTFFVPSYPGYICINLNVPKIYERHRVHFFCTFSLSPSLSLSPLSLSLPLSLLHLEEAQFPRKWTISFDFFLLKRERFFSKYIWTHFFFNLFWEPEEGIVQRKSPDPGAGVQNSSFFGRNFSSTSWNGLGQFSDRQTGNWSTLERGAAEMKAIRKPTEGFVFWTARIIVFVIRRCIIDRPGTELNSVCCLEYRPLPSRGGGGALRKILNFFPEKRRCAWAIHNGNQKEWISGEKKWGKFPRVAGSILFTASEDGSTSSHYEFVVRVSTMGRVFNEDFKHLFAPCFQFSKCLTFYPW